MRQAKVVIRCFLPLFVVFLVWDLMFRFFIIRPYTNLSGKYAAFIEEKHLFRWIVPTINDCNSPVDIYFCGNSHVMDGINPEIIERETGYRSFNLALYSLPSQNALELLFQYKHFPRLIFIDFAARYSVYQKHDHINCQADSALRMGKLKRVLYEACDRVQWIMPSLIIPRPFLQTLSRIPKKIIKLMRTGRMDFGRYTPFRPFVSYDWAIEKYTNHRIVRRNRNRSNWEIEAEKYYFEKNIKEAKGILDEDSSVYQEGMLETGRMIERLLLNQVKVVLMRMPLIDNLIEYENKNFSRFFNDIQTMALKLGIKYVDLNSIEHRKNIGELVFYTDGQHLIHPSCDHLSTYLSTLVRDELKK